MLEMLGDNRNTNQQYFQPFLSHKLVRTAYCISGGERRNTGENRQGEESRTARNISPRRPHYRPVPPLSDTDSRTQSHTVPPRQRNTPLGSREHRALPAGRPGIEMRFSSICQKRVKGDPYKNPTAPSLTWLEHS